MNFELELTQLATPLVRSICIKHLSWEPQSAKQICRSISVDLRTMMRNNYTLHFATSAVADTTKMRFSHREYTCITHASRASSQFCEFPCIQPHSKAPDQRARKQRNRYLQSNTPDKGRSTSNVLMGKDLKIRARERARSESARAKYVPGIAWPDVVEGQGAVRPLE